MNASNELNKFQIEQTDEAARTRLGVVTCFFETAKYNVIRDEQKGVKPEAIALGVDKRFEVVAKVLGVANWAVTGTIANIAHPYHAIWQKFTTWAENRGMVPRLDYHVEGENSWYEVAVAPV